MAGFDAEPAVAVSGAAAPRGGGGGGNGGGSGEQAATATEALAVGAQPTVATRFRRRRNQPQRSSGKTERANQRPRPRSFWIDVGDNSDGMEEAAEQHARESAELAMRWGSLAPLIGFGAVPATPNAGGGESEHMYVPGTRGQPSLAAAARVTGGAARAQGRARRLPSVPICPADIAHSPPTTSRRPSWEDVRYCEGTPTGGAAAELLPSTLPPRVMCSNHGCGKHFSPSHPPQLPNQCKFHPRPFDVNSIRGYYWPCCQSNGGSYQGIRVVANGVIRGCQVGDHACTPA
jgi:hypothetical protein